jgi:peptidoglycan lytic transglycosylase G
MLPTMLEPLLSRSERRSPTRRPRLRSLIVLFSLLVLLGVIAGGLGAFFWAIGASGPKAPIKELVVPNGATGSEVAGILRDQGVIRSTLAFRLLIKIRGVSSSFQAGKYDAFTTNMTVTEALDALKDGPFIESVVVTFPEGLRVDEMAERAARSRLDVKEKAFVNLAESGQFSMPPYLPEGTSTVEGFLYPDTYDFFKDATAKDVIQRLLEEFRTKTKGLEWGNAKELHVTEYEVMVMASIVEGEARFDEDRGRIARTLYNRLARGMRLQADVTVLYALDRRTGPVTFEDLKVDSPYNTYQHTGLPPTPIDSPRTASIQAALRPPPGNWLYYIADPQGHTHFTASYQEFLSLKRKYQG